MVEDQANAGEVIESPAPAEQRWWMSASKIDIIATVMLSIASLTTTWCAYQATLWNGDQSHAYAVASSTRMESTREYSRAMQLMMIDADLFVGWVHAYNDDDQELLEFYETHLMRPEFMPYLDAWVASNPRESPDAYQNPLMTTAYRESMFIESNRLLAEAEEKFDSATEASTAGDEYILATVLFASVLFFAGISSKFSSLQVRQVLIGMSVLMFLVGLWHLGGLPIR